MQDNKMVKGRQGTEKEESANFVHRSSKVNPAIKLEFFSLEYKYQSKTLLHLNITYEFLLHSIKQDYYYIIPIEISNSHFQILHIYFKKKYKFPRSLLVVLIWKWYSPPEGYQFKKRNFYISKTLNITVKQRYTIRL